MTLGFVLGIAAFFSTANLHAQQPTLNENGWTFILVPSFETANGTNNLSVTGLNHSLQFGQMLDQITSRRRGHLRRLFAFSTTEGDLAPLQGIEPFAVNSNLAVKVRTVSVGGPSSYGSAAYWVNDILANKPEGIYIFSAPLATVQDLAKFLTGAAINLEPSGQYIVVTGGKGHFSAQVYIDGINHDPAYPKVPPLPKLPACSQPPQSISAKVPPGLQAYKSLSVYFVRHVEAHPTSTFENGNYVCQGQWRALGAGGKLLEIMNRRIPNHVISPDPGNIIDCDGSCSYIRPTLTVTPFAIEHRLPMTLAQFQWNDPTDLANWLFDKASPYTTNVKDGESVLVGWEHGNIVAAVNAVFQNVYKDSEAAKKLPDWSFGDYDTVWKLSTDDKGNVTFGNTCEHIDSAKLPAVCPAFFPH